MRWAFKKQDASVKIFVPRNSSPCKCTVTIRKEAVALMKFKVQSELLRNPHMDSKIQSSQKTAKLYTAVLNIYHFAPSQSGTAFEGDVRCLMRPVQVQVLLYFVRIPQRPTKTSFFSWLPKWCHSYMEVLKHWLVHTLFYTSYSSPYHLYHLSSHRSSKCSSRRK